ncbi:PTS sugar transporter subunit IIA [Ruania rhizosphaerae]|uniref:PTS sugar transporter subunit IIA n=1 Tax=Ruania rhizosphaerae TaxID=1840413 RepID=UPI00135B9752|nr:PTS glucose transporter subunit IIA [Ruania rhizosphaerae]
MTLHVLAPVSGDVMAMSQVPDPVFAQEIVGPGAAIDPLAAAAGDPVDVLAPISGRILKLHPHAFVVVAASGQGVLVHLGVDTVQLGGEGFTVHVAEGESVERRQRMVTFSPREIADGGRSPVCPVVALEAVSEAVRIGPRGSVQAGESLLEWIE